MCEVRRICALEINSMSYYCGRGSQNCQYDCQIIGLVLNSRFISTEFQLYL